jgi:hypothetical protein
MRLCKFFSSIILMGFCLNVALASELKVVLKLTDIRVKKTIEHEGDDVYFNITQYSSLGHSSESRVPIYPAHWLSKQLSNVKQLELWEGTLKPSESVKLVIALSEQDPRPWDTGYLIGAVTLTVKNKKGRLEHTWDIPVFEEKNEVEMLKSDSPKRYVFKGGRSRYDVAFQVEQR